MDSTAECHILKLPVELLQLIAAAVPEPVYHYSALRLVCKDFEAAVFDAWADRWFGDLYCFIMDPVRVQRIANITSRKHFAQRVRSIRFCLDPWELAVAEQISIVMPKLSPIMESLDWQTLVLCEQGRVEDFH